MLPILLLLLASTVTSLPQGAPSSVCQTMTPRHGGGIPPQTSGAPFGVFPRRTSSGVSVTVTSTLGVQFLGFMLQGRTPSGEILGTFQPLSDTAHTLDCVDRADSLTHNDPEKKNVVEALWVPPQGYEGPIVFNATIAQDYATFWTGVQSPPVLIDKRSIANDPPFTIPIPHGISPPPPSFTPTPHHHEASTNFDPFYDGCGVSKLCFGAPNNCVEKQTCTAMVAVSVKVDRYEFELKAQGDAAWVAVGLSEDAKMKDDSVIECVKEGGAVNAYMSWTSGPPDKYGVKRLPNPKYGIQLLNGTALDDGLYCKVRRNTQTTVMNKPFNLQTDTYHLLVATGKSATDKGVTFHDLAFAASGEKRALADVSPLAAAARVLVKIHGSFMIAAWIGAASIGILLARYFKQTWVGSTLCGKDLWFAWHRMLMVLTWSLTMIGFVLIFVELRAWSAENNPHAILGTITTIICFLQPIGAFFRPHPGTPRRPIFNWGHWLGGNLAHIIGIVAIFLSVTLTKAQLPDFVYWILCAYVVFHVVMHILLSVMNCLSERNSGSRVTSLPMKDLAGSGRNAHYPDRSDDAPHSGMRRFLLGLYIVIVLAIAIALIVIISLAPIEDAWNVVKSTVMNRN